MTTEPPPEPGPPFEPDPEPDEAESESWFDEETWNEPAPSRGMARWSLVVMTVLTVALVGVLIGGRVAHNNKHPSAKARQTAADIQSLNQSVQSLNSQLATVNSQIQDAVTAAKAKARLAEQKAAKKAGAAKHPRNSRG